MRCAGHHRRSASTPAPTRSPSASSRARRSPTTSRAGCSRRWSTPARRGPALRKLAVTHADGRRWILVGLGRRDELRRRARPRRRRHGRRPGAGAGDRDALLGAARTTSTTPSRRGFVEGTLLAAYAYRAYKTGGGDDDAAGSAAARSPPTTTSPRAVAPRGGDRRRRQRRARPPERAGQRDDADAPRRARPRARRASSTASAPRPWAAPRSRPPGMGAFAGVARGSDEEPQLITLRYEPRRRARARCSGSSARRSPSTPAASRSSPGRR